MDMLDDPLDEPVISPIPKEEQASGLVIEDSEIVDCESDPISAEDQLNYPETLAYRVVQVANGSPSGTEIELPVSQTANNTLQVLTSPINGQFYVIGSANDVFTTAQTTRAVIAPRATASLQVDTPRSNPPGLKKRDDRRRATHNEVERRRRDKINNWIAKLGKIIPECNGTTSNGANGEAAGKANYETQSKGGILAKACEYINELREANQSMSQCLRENEKLRQEIQALKSAVTQLKRENAQLKQEAASHSVSELLS